MRVHPMIRALMFTTAFGAAFATTAQQDPDDGKRRRGPPPEAIEACANADEGAQCTFDTPNGDAVSGVCRTPPKVEGGLACVPANHRRPR